MFLQDFLLIGQPYDVVAGRLRADPAALLTGGFEAARTEAAHLRAQVGPRGWPAVVSETAAVRPGPLRDRGDSVLMAFGWEVPGDEGLFLRLDADLEVAPFGADRTWATLRARYNPIGSRVASAADQLILQRMAESTARAFLIGARATIQHGLGGSRAGMFEGGAG